MECRNHPGTAPVAVCAGCAESYCGNCLVEVRGARYCAGCKRMALPATATAGTVPCTEATDALKWALASFVCFGIILGPIAIKKAFDAKKRIAADPSLTGGGRAEAAIVLGLIAVGFWFLGMVHRSVNR